MNLLMNKFKRIYVASSWRNPMQTAVVAGLRSAGIDCYDFKHPALGNEGFHWSEVMNDYVAGSDRCDQDEYLKALTHPIAQHGFRRDYDAMRSCDACICVLPCGRSAHLELGWFAGQGTATAILLDGPIVTPELMYLICDYIAPTFFDLLGWVGVED